MDLVILLVLLGLVIFFFKRFSNVIYFVAITDILLRIISFAKVQLAKGDIYAFMDKYIPNNIPTILGHYSSGLLYTILLWIYVAVFIIFEFYIIRIFFKRK